jgi:hypothetical protein
LSTLADEWLERNVPAGTLPLGGSEVACLVLGDEPRLAWLLTEKSPELRIQIAEKMKSKFDVAKFFLGALVVNAGVLLNAPVVGALARSTNMAVKILLTVGLVAMALALGFSVATLLAFDRLTMPPEFWAEGGDSDVSPPWSVRRPPSDATVVLFYEMMHVWTRFFEPALGSALVALSSFGTAIVLDAVRMSALSTVLTLMSLLGTAGVLINYYLKRRPRLGFQD